MVAELEARGKRMVAAKLEPNSGEERRRAVRLVASWALDVDDCVNLLGMLGLRAEEGKEISESPAGEGEVVPDQVQGTEPGV